MIVIIYDTDPRAVKVKCRAAVSYLLDPASPGLWNDASKSSRTQRPERLFDLAAGPAGYFTATQARELGY